jgi:hypothetical protein
MDIEDIRKADPTLSASISVARTPGWVDPEVERRDRALELSCSIAAHRATMGPAEIMTLAVTFNGWLEKGWLPDFVINGEPMTKCLKLVDPVAYQAELDAVRPFPRSPKAK